MKSDKVRKLERLDASLKSGYKQTLMKQQKRFASCVSKIEALSPLAVLTRGYSIVLKDGAAVKSAELLKNGDRVNLRMCDGTVGCVVEEENRS